MLKMNQVNIREKSLNDCSYVCHQELPNLLNTALNIVSNSLF